MVWLIGFLLIVISILLWYVKRLREELRAHENNWIKIENMTDHNQEGDLVIHCRSRKDTNSK